VRLRRSPVTGEVVTYFWRDEDGEPFTCCGRIRIGNLIIEVFQDWYHDVESCQFCLVQKPDTSFSCCRSSSRIGQVQAARAGSLRSCLGRQSSYCQVVCQWLRCLRESSSLRSRTMSPEPRTRPWVLEQLRHPPAEIGQLVAMAVSHLENQPLTFEPPQMVRSRRAHRARLRFCQPVGSWQSPAPSGRSQLGSPRSPSKRGPGTITPCNIFGRNQTKRIQDETTKLLMKKRSVS
jgi:hypothetical protein